ncbi:T3SS effector HopA1 family protein [Nonomuraea sp. NPDC000554]|uniref:T3SS effector HopA1 family protein n=1 Tax=Nonomuraea sp. NPDC000554 TaxID=3154259 RepID=UPI003321497B
MSVADLTVPSALLPVLDAVDVDLDRLRATVADVTVEAESSLELGVRLAQTCYEVFHSGRRPDGDGPLPFHIRDREFERVLAERVPHARMVAPGVLCETVAAEEGSMVLVQCGGPRVWVPRDRILTEPPLTRGRTVDLALSPMRPALSPGFFFVHGSAAGSRDDVLLRVYIHLADPRRAGDVWAGVLSHLEERGAEYRAKVLSSPLLYPRRDALVVYLGTPSHGLASELADLVAGLPGVGDETSAFARRLGPGVATAWEPDDRRPAMKGMSFGQHRAGVVAQALVEAATGGVTFAEAVAAKFAEANIDPCDLARNRTSPEAVAGGRCTCPLFSVQATPVERR